MFCGFGWLQQARGVMPSPIPAYSPCNLEVLTIRFGVTFHHEYSWWWWQTAFGADGPDGLKPGVPHDGHLTLADGKGKWWEGFDPRLLYGVDLREYKGVAAAAMGGIPQNGYNEVDIERPLRVGDQAANCLDYG